MSDSLFYGTILALFLAMVGHPVLAVLVFIIAL
jgi:hypothetical protein